LKIGLVYGINNFYDFYREGELDKIYNEIWVRQVKIARLLDLILRRC